MPDNNKPTKGWSERRRKQQACNARRNKPWKNSTGPRTEAGKKASRMNALKNGHRAASIKALEEGLRLHREFLRHIMIYNAAGYAEQALLVYKRTKGKCVEKEEDSRGKK